MTKWESPDVLTDGLKNCCDNGASFIVSGRENIGEGKGRCRFDNILKGFKNTFHIQSTFSARTRRKISTRGGTTAPFSLACVSISPTPPRSLRFVNSVGNQFSVNYKGGLFTLLN